MLAGMLFPGFFCVFFHGFLQMKFCTDIDPARGAVGGCEPPVQFIDGGDSRLPPVQGDCRHCCRMAVVKHWPTVHAQHGMVFRKRSSAECVIIECVVICVGSEYIEVAAGGIELCDRGGNFRADLAGKIPQGTEDQFPECVILTVGDDEEDPFFIPGTENSAASSAERTGSRSITEKIPP